MARKSPATPRFDQPLEPRRRSLVPSVDGETFGRQSERIARFIGSWLFIAYMTGFVAIWMLWNIAATGTWRFDAWPFIGLTLMLSLQASYAAPLILLAQNRQTDRDRVQYQEDRQRTDRLIADADYLAREVASLRQAIGELATRDYLRTELRDLLEELLEDEPARRPRPRARENGGEGYTSPGEQPTTSG